MLPTWLLEELIDSEVFTAIFFVFPIFWSNVSTAIFGGGLPMDFRKNWFDGKRILGNNKTIRGFATGLIVGFLVGLFSWWLLTEIVIVNYEIKFYYGLLLGLGTVVGDAVGSFIKRRMNIPSGGSLIGVDQIGYVLFGLIFGRMLVAFPWTYWLITIPLAGMVHFASNTVSYLIGWKDVWW